MVRTTFRIGDWIAVRLRDDRWVPARIARVQGYSLFLYVFARPTPEPPTLDDVADLNAAESGFQIKASGLALKDGRWKLLGGADDFDRAAWPLPEFERRIDLPNGDVIRFADTFDDVRINRRISGRQLPDDDTAYRPENSISGSGAAEIRITRWINDLEDSPTSS